MKPPGRLAIGLATAATTLLLVLIGAAAMLLPAHFDDATAPPAAGSGTSLATGAPAGTARQPAAGSLITATFNQLAVAPLPSTTARAADAAAGNATGGDESLTSNSGAPTMHFVQTTTIHATPPAGGDADGAPAPDGTADGAPAVDGADPAATATGTPAAGTPPAVVETATADTPTVADDPPVPLPAPQAAAAGGSTQVGGSMMTVAGAGVTVRSGPSKSDGQLFNLAAGQKVTVGARQRGWVQVTDASGRHGWAYSSFLKS